TPEVMREELDHVVDSTSVQVLEPVSGRGVVLPSPALQDARIHHVLGQRMLEAVEELRLLRAREDEVEAVELPQMSRYLIRSDVQDTRQQRDSKRSEERRVGKECKSRRARYD